MADGPRTGVHASYAKASSLRTTTNPFRKFARVDHSQFPSKLSRGKTWPRVHADPINSNYAVLQLRRFIDSFFFSRRLQIPPDPSLSLSSRKNLRNIVASPRHCTGEHFSFFFFFFYYRPGSFRKRALTVEPRGGCKVSDAFPRDNFDIMKYRRGSSIKLD